MLLVWEIVSDETFSFFIFKEQPRKKKEKQLIGSVESLFRISFNEKLKKADKKLKQ